MNTDMIPAGRELDALVAEKVMGLKVEMLPIMYDEDYEGQVPRFSTAEWEKEMREEAPDWQRESWDSDKGPVVVEGGDRKYVVRPYSTDIAAAWEVVEKMRKMGWEPTIALQKAHVYAITYDASYDELSRAYAEHAPLAICRAALKAVTR